MSDIDVQHVIHRQVAGELQLSGDGRTLDLRVVPYNTVARVSDPPHFKPYDEVWMPGAFNKQLSAANRVLMNFEHQPGLRDVVGRGLELREMPDGLEGSFRMLSGPDADKALELVNENVLTGVSVEAVVTETTREDGLVKRMKARLVNIALTRIPAYEDAQVLAVREQPPEDPPPAEPPQPLPEEAARRSEVDELLERVGFEPITVRAVTSKPWSGAASKYADTVAYCKACLIDKNPAGEEKVQANCMLPVYEPDGTLNRNALGAAAARLNQVTAPSDVKAAAARKLIRLYGQVPDLQPPASLRMTAAR